MRKTSQDGGDATSITSGIENEIKKSGAAIKSKRNSIKRKVQNFGHESDDAVIEPLLQKDKEKTEKTETAYQSAKYLMSKSNTETESDKDQLLADHNTPQISGVQGTSENTVSHSSTKENLTPKPQMSSTASIHNHMNTNVFNNFDATKGITAPKSHILVEIDGSRQVGYNPSPLIFTTAKIHTDSKTKHMEPVHVTAVPILSTIEVSVLKTGKVSEGSSIALVTSSPAVGKVADKQQKVNVPATTSNCAPGEMHKDTASKTTSESKLRNTSEQICFNNNTRTKNAVPLTAATDNKVSKAMKSTNSNEDVVIKSTTTNYDSKIKKMESFTKTTSPQMTQPLDITTFTTSIVNTAQSACAMKDNTVVTSMKNMKLDESDEINNTVHPIQKEKLDDLKKQETKMDVNKNVKSNVDICPQQREKEEKCNNVKLFMNSKESSDMPIKDKLIKDANKPIVSKQLPRQKNAIMEDNGDLDLSSKPSCSDNSTSSNATSMKDSADETTPPTKAMLHSKISENYNLSDKNMPKLSANNIISNTASTTAKSSSKVTANVATSKIPSQISMSVMKPIATTSTSLSTSVTAPTVTSARSNSAPSNNVKNKSLAITKPSTSTVTTAASGVMKLGSSSAPLSSSKLQTTIAKPTSTTSSTVAPKLSTVSSAKSSYAGVNPQIPAATKLPVTSSIKSSMVKTTPPPKSIGQIQVSSTVGSPGSSSTSKQSITKTNNAPLSSAKPQVTSSFTTIPNTTPAAVPVAKTSMSSKKKVPKSSELNKDDKGSKA